LTEYTAFANTPAFMGALEYRRDSAEPMVLCLLQQFVPNEGDAWSYTLGSTGRYIERVLAKRVELQEVPKAPAALLQIVAQEPPAILRPRTATAHRRISCISSITSIKTASA
jgi:maltose alpha-D-glucosyltransferase/alpha-amylase